MTPLPASDAPAAEWLVFADALQQQGDPRGELIALIHAGDVAKRDAHLRQHAQALLGQAATLVERGVLKLTWHWSLIDAAEVRGHSAATVSTAVDALLAAPTVRPARGGVGDEGAARPEAGGGRHPAARGRHHRRRRADVVDRSGVAVLRRAVWRRGPTPRTWPSRSPPRSCRSSRCSRRGSARSGWWGTSMTRAPTPRMTPRETSTTRATARR